MFDVLAYDVRNVQKLNNNNNNGALGNVFIV